MPGTLARSVGCAAIGAALWLAPLPARAVDGVVEINQTRAQAGGITPGDTAGFPVSITRGGSYRLTGDLTIADADTDVILISAGVSNVTLDLNGFTIRGPIACSGTPVVCSPSSGTGDGIDAIGDVSNVTVVNGTVQGLGKHGILLATATAVRVERVRAVGNRLIGILVATGTVVDSLAVANGDDGISASGSATLGGNTCVGNGGDGIFAASGSTVTGNTAANNIGFGLNAGGVVTVGYALNVFTCNNSGGTCTDGAQVSGGTQIGANLCGLNSTCP